MYQNQKLAYATVDDGVEAYSLGQPAQKEYKIPFVPNGTDLTGEGHPDMIVTSWSGGAHCCYAHYIFELRPKLRLLATIQDGDAEAYFEKIDGRYYYVTRDIWSYWPASFASSTSHKVLLKWSGDRFRIDLEKMRYRALTAEQWRAALKDVDDAVAEDATARDALGVTLWDTVLDLIYTGHSELAWKFVREVNPKALQGNNPDVEEFCTMLKSDPYWPDLGPTMKDMPQECNDAKPGRRE